MRIERLLGRGGMGEVHLGYHEGFDVPVAVKLLPVRSSSPSQGPDGPVAGGAERPDRAN